MDSSLLSCSGLWSSSLLSGGRRRRAGFMVVWLLTVVIVSCLATTTTTTTTTTKTTTTSTSTSTTTTTATVNNELFSFLPFDNDNDESSSSRQDGDDDDDVEELADATRMDDSLTTPVPPLAASSSSWLLRRMLQDTVTDDDTTPLQPSDFAPLNSLLDNAQIQLPDTAISNSGLDLVITNLYCQDVAIIDLRTDFNQTDYRTVVNTLAIQFAVTCVADYAYTFPPFFSGNGKVTAVTQNNRLETAVQVQSVSGFWDAPPSQVTVLQCSSQLDITDMDFDGGVVASLLEMLQGVLDDVIEKAVEDVLCKQLASSHESLSHFLNQTTNRLAPYLTPVSAERANPVLDEINAVASAKPNAVAEWLLLKDGDEGLAVWVDRLLPQATAMLSEYNAAEDTLGINVMIRKRFLDEMGAFVWNFTKKENENNNNDNNAENPSNQIQFNRTLYAGQDRLTQTTITMQQVRILGLDSLTTFQPLTVIGNYTLQNNLSWDYLQAEIDLLVDIQPSTREDTLIVDPDPVRIQDEITVTVGLHTIELVLSIFLAVNQTTLHQLSLGSLLVPENLYGCLLSTVEAWNVSGLDVSVVGMDDPVLDGFISKGVDRVVSHAVQSAFAMYEPTLLKAMAPAMQTMGRDFLNTHLLASLLENNGKPHDCPLEDWTTAETKSAAVDFRDLLLKPEDAVTLGGTGKTPYGPLAYRAYQAVLDRFTAADEEQAPDGDGLDLAMLNRMMIRPWTEQQSGLAGRLQWNSSLVEWSRENMTHRALADIMDRFTFRLYDAHMENLDTIVNNPLSLLQPTNSATVLSNVLHLESSRSNSGTITTTTTRSLSTNVSNVFVANTNSTSASSTSSSSTSSTTTTNRPLTLSIRMLLEMAGKEPFNMMNEIEFTAAIYSLQMSADVAARLDADTVSSFPIGDMADLDCWMAAAALTRDAGAQQPGLALQTFEMSFTDLHLDATCISCSSRGAPLLPSLIALLKQSGAHDTLVSRIPSFVKGLVQSEWLQAMIDRRVQEAPKYCPFRPEYVPGVNRTHSNASVGIPVLSAEALDTVLYTGILALWMGFLIFAEDERYEPVPTTDTDVDPLAAQKAFQKPDNASEVLDWTNLGNSTGLGTMADQAMNQLQEFLNGKDDNGTYRINGFLKNILNDAGEYSLELETKMERDGLVLSLDSIVVTGLDSFQFVHVMDPIGAQTLNNTLHMQSIGVELKLSAGYNTSAEPPQQLTIRVALEDIRAELVLFAAFDVTRLKQLPLRTFLRVKNILPCVLSAALDVQIPHLNVSIGSFQSVTVKGLLPDTAASATRVLDAAVEQYRVTVEESIPKIVQGALKEMLSTYIASFIKSSNCPSPPESTRSMYVDFRELLLSEEQSLEYGGDGTSPYGDLFRTVLDLVQKELIEVDPVTGESALNDKIIRPWTEKSSGIPGRLVFAGDLFNRGGSVAMGGLNAQVHLRMYDAYLDNLDSLGNPLELLQAVRGEPYQINNTLTAGAMGKPFGMGSRFTIELTSDGTDIRNDVEASISLDTLSVALTMMAKIVESIFLDLPIEALGQWKCWLAMLANPKLDKHGVRLPGSEIPLSLVDLGLSVVKMVLNVTCIDCTGPTMPAFSELLSRPESIDESTKVANALLDYITKLLEGNYLQVTMDRLVADAKKECPFSPDYEKDFAKPVYAAFDSPARDEDMSLLVAVFITLTLLVVAISALTLAKRWFVARRHQKWLETLDAEKVAVLIAQQRQQDEKMAALNQASKSLFESHEIPAVIRYAIPLIIIGNIAFFLSGHLSYGGSVVIMATLAGESYVGDNFFDFSMASSVIQMWQAGGKELAILLIIVAGVWPYTKQAIALALWFLPPTIVSVTTRENAYLWLDALAKWSILDIFVLVMTLASFRISVQSPDVSFLPSGFYALDLLVIPKWGLYANMIAQLISQISSHYIIHYHRYVVSCRQLALEHQEQAAAVAHTLWDLERIETEEMSLDEVNTSDGADGNDANNNDQVEQLCAHAFARPHRGETEKLVARPYVNPLFVGLTAALFVLVVTGCSVSSYSLDIIGIIGILVETGQHFKDATSSYNVFQTAGVLMNQAAFTGRGADYVGLGTLATLLVSTVLIVPISQSIVLMYMWFQPMTRKLRYRWMIVLEILAAWQYAEVYLLSVMVASWQLGPVSEYMINAYCGSLDGTFAQMVYYGIIKKEDAQCFRVNTSIDGGFFILAAAAVLLALLNTFVLKAVRQYDRDKDQQEHDKAQNSPPRRAMLKQLTTTRAEEFSDDAAKFDEIRPVPVLFSDTFRWLLDGEKKYNDIPVESS